jgi:predicted lipid carrier protein YhbT
MKINPPEIFCNMCETFHPYDDLTEDQLVREMLKGVSREQLPDLQMFLAELLSGRYSKSEVKDIWNRCLVVFVFTSSKGAYSFTEQLRDAVE